jgi:hypothetical protein
MQSFRSGNKNWMVTRMESLMNRFVAPEKVQAKSQGDLLQSPARIETKLIQHPGTLRYISCFISLRGPWPKTLLGLAAAKTA